MLVQVSRLSWTWDGRHASMCNPKILSGSITRSGQQTVSVLFNTVQFCKMQESCVNDLRAAVVIHLHPMAVPMGRHVLLANAFCRDSHHAQKVELLHSVGRFLPIWTVCNFAIHRFGTWKILKDLQSLSTVWDFQPHCNPAQDCKVTCSQALKKSVFPSPKQDLTSEVASHVKCVHQDSL